MKSPNNDVDGRYYPAVTGFRQFVRDVTGYAVGGKRVSSVSRGIISPVTDFALDLGIGSRLYNWRVGHQNGKNGSLQIGELARAVGVSADTLRHYERKGLLKPLRQSNGYREYPQHAPDRVRMIRRALALGFRLDDLARIFKVRDAGGAPCRQVRELAAAKLDEVETLLGELTAMRGELRRLLKDWDQRLDSTSGAEPARLLETLAATGITRAQALAPLRSNSPKRKRN